MKKSVIKTIIISLLLVAVVGTSLIAFVGCDEIEVGYLPEETLHFDVDFEAFKLQALDDAAASMNLPSKTLYALVPKLAKSIFDKDATYIELTKDGTFTLSLTINVEGIQSALVSIGNLVKTDLSDIGALTSSLTKESLDPYVKGYVEVLFPGFEFTDVDSILGMLKAIGITLEAKGLEDNAEIQKLVAHLEDPNEATLIPEDFNLANLPEKLTIKLSGPYKFIDSFSTDGTKTCTMATIGYHDSDTLPLMNFYYTTYEDGSQTIMWRNEMLGITLQGKIDAPATEA